LTKFPSLSFIKFLGKRINNIGTAFGPRLRASSASNRQARVKERYIF